LRGGFARAVEGGSVLQRPLLWRVISPLTIPVLALLYILNTAAPAAAACKPQGSTPADKFVFEELLCRQTGSTIKLAEHFPAEGRVLSPSFLQNLLDGSFGVKVHYHGIRIEDGVVKEKFDLRGAEIPFETALIHFLFKKDLDVSQSHFAKGFTLTDTQIYGPVDFSNATISGQFLADDAKFTSTGGASFTGMKVGGLISIKRARFLGRVDFSNATISGQFLADEAKFKNTDLSGGVDFSNAHIAGKFQAYGTILTGGVDFSNARIVGDFLIGGTNFGGPVTFRDADIAGNFHAEQVKCIEATAVANFNHMRVGGSANFQKAKFAGALIFEGANIAGPLVADEASFEDASSSPLPLRLAVSFGGLKVGSLSVQNAIFAGPVNFSDANIAGPFLAGGAVFTSAEEVTFRGLKVGGLANIENVIFTGPVDFSDANIAGPFLADGTMFTSTEEVSLRGLKAGGLANIENARFTGPVDFGDANIGGLFLADGAVFASIQKRVSFRGLKVGGLANIENASFTGPVDFSNADITGSFQADGNFEGAVDFSGTHYQDISPGSSWEGLLDLFGRAKYSPSSYVTLETVLQQQGYPERAYKASLRQKQRAIVEAYDTYPGKTPGGIESKDENLRMAIWNALVTIWNVYVWFGNWLWDALVFLLAYVLSFGGSLSPYTGAGILSIIIVLVGFLVFRPGPPIMMLKDPKEKDMNLEYSSLWYSIDLFAPVLNLDVASHWIPDPNCRLRSSWWFIHRFLGWALLSSAVFASALK
jgi:uncharacterized protein YjbI with pentapeptide repeats